MLRKIADAAESLWTPHYSDQVSFGAASAARGFRRVAPTDPCPCGAGRFDGCCGPVLRGESAPTAERLMRSRYTAFVVGDADHLRRTWHPRTRPVDVAPDPETVWLGLEILATGGGDPSDTEGTVEFRARWIEQGVRGALRERSRFVRRGGRWVYLDGIIL